jgi:hypothetical protein
MALNTHTDIRSELQVGWVNTNESLAKLASDAEAAAVALDNRLSVQKSAQDTNNREQVSLCFVHKHTHTHTHTHTYTHTHTHTHIHTHTHTHTHTQLRVGR